MRALRWAVALVLVAGCAGPSGVHRSVGYQNLKDVQDYVQRGGNINSLDGMKHTPLILAAYYGSAPIAHYLCDKGAEVNPQDVEGRTALLWATYYGHLEIVSILLKKGADPNIRDVYGYNALGYAQKFDREEIASLLKSHGAQPLFPN